MRRRAANSPLHLDFRLQNFFLNLVILGFGAFFFCIVSSAYYVLRHKPDYGDYVPLIATSYLLVIFCTLWWLMFLDSCQKFIAGYSVGAWYFDE